MPQKDLIKIPQQKSQSPKRAPAGPNQKYQMAPTQIDQNYGNKTPSAWRGRKVPIGTRYPLYSHTLIRLSKHTRILHFKRHNKTVHDFNHLSMQFQNISKTCMMQTLCPCAVTMPCSTNARQTISVHK